ncbi:PEP-CTERM protein-sorting domain-containing protein [Rubritalea squalenifaciens DSM 18772]|uniref:PEP-CTERM protein-sorting domain-containing protein n=1 Tax=Rubritalea squalenifaciens DSM 18772 TaxID=1123071 RepID=A0A1M6GYW6_9BACT|nr:PEP-CTERM sorting domain-containing protein [Rubritalea squalenifaciens]SHJ15104.1 PEP-CTERM protein-sorting domain-containing protein [Rubritalea squalenifaciens DSM 18772]
MKHSILTATLALALTSIAPAAIVYNNGTPNNFYGNIAGVAHADYFTLNQALSFNTIRVWIGDISDGGFSGDLGWAIWTDDTGLPGSILHSGADNAPTSSDSGIEFNSGRNYLQVDIDTGSVDLNAGNYWLQIHENAIGQTGDGSNAFWAFSSSSGNYAVEPDEVNLENWRIEPNGSFAFQLIQTTSVPEPTSTTLIGLASLTLIFRRRR